MGKGAWEGVTSGRSSRLGKLSCASGRSVTWGGVILARDPHSGGLKGLPISALVDVF